MIVLIGGEKGGVGKTTIAVNLAIANMLLGKQEVLLIDTDKQSSASYFCSLRAAEKLPQLNNIQLFSDAIRTEIPKLATKYDQIVIDAGGHDSSELRNALVVADIAIFPLRPSQLDLFTIKRLKELSSQAQVFNPKLRSQIVFSQCPTHYLDDELKSGREMCESIGDIAIMRNHVCERKVYRTAIIDGRSVLEAANDTNSAVKEISQIYQEVYTDHE